MSVQTQTRRVRLRTLADRIADGDLHGYKLGPPPGANPENTSIDREVAAASACDFCGYRGLNCRQFHSLEERSYRAIACCPACGHTVDF